MLSNCFSLLKATVKVLLLGILPSILPNPRPLDKREREYDLVRDKKLKIVKKRDCGTFALFDETKI